MKSHILGKTILPAALNARNAPATSLGVQARFSRERVTIEGRTSQSTKSGDTHGCSRRDSRHWSASSSRLAGLTSIAGQPHHPSGEDDDQGLLRSLSLLHMDPPACKAILDALVRTLELTERESGSSGSGKLRTWP